MILSHKHKFIFLKTNKTAGTSIEIALSKHCGPNDIITPISPEDEQLRTELGYPGPQNYLLPLRSYGVREMSRLVLRRKRTLAFYNHMLAAEVKERIGEQIWNSYFKFCVERNPWDRIISHYYWHYKSEPRPSLYEYIHSRKPLILKERGYCLYTIDNQVAVDRICRFENIAEEVEEVRKHVGIPDSLDLPRAKSSTRKDRRSYHDVLEKREIDAIAELFCDEIRLFGYT